MEDFITEDTLQRFNKTTAPNNPWNAVCEYFNIKTA